jgi:hypothetical protein
MRAFSQAGEDQPLHECTLACVRAREELALRHEWGTVADREVERFLSDWPGKKAGDTQTPKERVEKSVAVIAPARRAHAAHIPPKRINVTV